MMPAGSPSAKMLRYIPDTSADWGNPEGNLRLDLALDHAGAQTRALRRLTFPEHEALVIDWQPSVDAFHTGTPVYSGSSIMTPFKREGRDTMLINSSSTYLNCGTTYAKSASFTIATAFMLPSLSGSPGLGGAINSGTSATTWGYLESVSSGKVRVQFGDGSNSRVNETSAIVLTEGKWHSLVVSYTTGNSTVSIYVDGVLVASSSTSGSATTAAGGTAADYRIGLTFASSLNGYMGSYHAWNVPLTGGQAEDVHATLAAAYNIT